MKRSRFSDEQIIGMIKEQEAGTLTAEVCRKHGISTASCYKYKAKSCLLQCEYRSKETGTKSGQDRPSDAAELFAKVQ